MEYELGYLTYCAKVCSIEGQGELVLIDGVYNECAEIFNERHRDRNVSHVYILKSLQNFREFGFIGNAKQDRPKVLDEAAEIELLGGFGADPAASVRKVSTKTGISIGSINKVTK